MVSGVKFLASPKGPDVIMCPLVHSQRSCDWEDCPKPVRCPHCAKVIAKKNMFISFPRPIPANLSYCTTLEGTRVSSCKYNGSWVHWELEPFQKPPPFLHIQEPRYLLKAQGPTFYHGITSLGRPGRWTNLVLTGCQTQPLRRLARSFCVCHVVLGRTPN